jgi:hypothetical protein
MLMENNRPMETIMSTLVQAVLATQVIAMPSPKPQTGKKTSSLLVPVLPQTSSRH